METNGKPASKRELAYIRRPQMVVGEDEPEISEEMSVSEASYLISELISRARQNGFLGVQRQISEPRLGICYCAEGKCNGRTSTIPEVYFGAACQW